MVSSRTNKSIINGQIAILYYVANMLLGFYSRKIFIDYVGIDVLGLNQTAQNLLGFLNLAELGIGSAVAFTLFKPIANRDKNSINEIVTLQGWLYRKIAIIVGIGALVLMCFFPIIFKKIELPLWYAYTSFIVFLYSSLLTYFINYRQIILSASQQEYKITISYNGVLLLKSIVQILAMRFLPNPYIWWLIIQVIFATIASLNLNRVIFKTFPFLKEKTENGKYLVKRYSVITTKIKQTFFHSIGGFVLSQSSSFLIYAFVNLKMVAIYGNYMLIANCIRMLFNSMFAGLGAGIGNLIAEGNKKKAMRIFEEVFSAKFLIITSALIIFYKFVNPFMAIWIGDNLYLEKSTILIIVAILYILLSRTTVDSYIAATGQFQDVWAPIVEAALNIGISVWLGSIIGINGVLLGSLSSLVLIIFIWKPFFLFKYGLKISILKYIKIYIIHILAFIISVLISNLIWGIFNLNIAHNYLSWAIQVVCYGIIFLSTLAIVLYLFSQGMRDFIFRILHTILKRK